MTLLLPIALGTLLALAGTLAAITIAAYFLRMRRRRFEVPFSSLWQRILEEHESTALWKQLRRWLSLLLLLFILGLLCFAATEPRVGAGDAASHSVVIILDASASMQATDGGGNNRPRIDVARERVAAELDRLAGSSVMVIRMDSQSTPLSRFSDDLPLLKQTVMSVQASDTPADLRSALMIARDALRGRKNPAILLVGDGAYPRAVLDSVLFTPRTPAKLDDIDLSGIALEFLPVGSSGENVGIVAFNARRYITNKLSYEVFFEIENFGKQPAERQLTLLVDGDPIETRPIKLAPGQRLRDMLPNLGGNQGTELTARLEPVTGQPFVDLLPLDDVARALLPERRRQRVLVVTPDNLYLEGALLVYDNVVYEKLTPEQYDLAVKNDRLETFDAVIFDGVAPAALPPGPGHSLYFGPTGDGSPFRITGSLPAPRVTETHPDHPVSRWLVLSDVNFESSSVFEASGGAEVVLARSIRSPLIVARRTGGRKIVATGFKLSATDLTLRAAFPLFMVNTLEWFSGDDTDLITTYATGRRVELPVDSTFQAVSASVTRPDGVTLTLPVETDRVALYPEQAGKYNLTFTAKDGATARQDLVANLASASESAIAPNPALTAGGRALPPPGSGSVGSRRTLWKFLICLAALLLAAEWFTYHRRITV